MAVVYSRRFMCGISLCVGILIRNTLGRRHPNFLSLMGRSPKGSHEPYLVYQGGGCLIPAYRRWICVNYIYRHSAERTPASALGEGLYQSVIIGLTIVR
jgi:hypothetical protein